MASLMLQAVLLAAPPLMWWCLAVWLFVLGAAIGSFINVVVYRLPLGLSLLYPPSRCPACETPIRPRDNVPMFGWLLLGGRCRQCGVSISPRYPLVEFMTAMMFLALAVVGPLSAADPPDDAAGAANADQLGALFGVYAYHLLLLCALLCAALTEFDGARFSPRLIWSPLVVGLLAPLAWPDLRPSAGGWTAIGGDWITGQWSDARPLVDGLAGLVAGVACGYLVGRLARWCGGRAAPASYDPRRPAVALAWVGLFLGWPAAAVLTLAIAVVDVVVWAWRVVSRRPRRAGAGGFGPVVYLFPAALAWILVWRYDRLFVDLAPWRG
jgi:leader peptidase (prepilin peptidase) / N-methyltransferase